MTDTEALLKRAEMLLAENDQLERDMAADYKPIDIIDLLKSRSKGNVHVITAMAKAKRDEPEFLPFLKFSANEDSLYSMLSVGMSLQRALAVCGVGRHRAYRALELYERWADGDKVKNTESNRQTIQFAYLLHMGRADRELHLAQGSQTDGDIRASLERSAGAARARHDVEDDWIASLANRKPAPSASSKDHAAEVDEPALGAYRRAQVTDGEREATTQADAMADPLRDVT